LVCLSGYRKKIGATMLNGFDKRILNIHPSLLPDYSGHGMYGDIVHALVLKSGRNKTGISIHIVDENYDTGPIIVQKEVPVMKTDTVMSLGNRVRTAEPALYIETVKQVLSGEWILGKPGYKSEILWP
jgi:phosphoribosylglycinamide formyltransferase-1